MKELSDRVISDTTAKAKTFLNIAYKGMQFSSSYLSYSLSFLLLSASTKQNNVMISRTWLKPDYDTLRERRFPLERGVQMYSFLSFARFDRTKKKQSGN